MKLFDVTTPRVNPYFGHKRDIRPNASASRASYGRGGSRGESRQGECHGIPNIAKLKYGTTR